MLWDYYYYCKQPSFEYMYLNLNWMECRKWSVFLLSKKCVQCIVVYVQCSMFMYLFVIFLLHHWFIPLLWVSWKKKYEYLCASAPIIDNSPHDAVVCRVVDHFSKIQEVNAIESLTFAATLIAINVCILCKYWILFAYAKAPMAIFGYALHFLFTLFSPAISIILCFLMFIVFTHITHGSNSKCKQNI